MTARARRKAVVLLAGLILAPRGVAADWQQFLAKPLSPGSVALLVERASEPHVRARWAEALKDSRPAVRAAAARAVNVTATVSLLPEVAAALAVETDGSAAAEEAEALAALEGRARDEDLLAAVRRVVRFAPAIAMALARSRGREALGHTALIAALSDEAAMPPFVRLATRRDPATLAYAGAVAIRERNTSMWSAVLGIARDADVATDEGILISSLQVAELRATTLWHLVLASAQPSARVSEALESSSEGTGQSDHAGARLAYEIVRRRLGRPVREDAGWLAALRDPGPAGAPFELGHHREALRRLTSSELSALSERVRGDARELAKWLRAKDPRFPDRGRVRATGSDGKRPVTLRIPDEFPPGLVWDVLQVGGCAPRPSDMYHGGQVDYAQDGRPRTVTMMAPGDLSTECVQAVKALLFLTLAPAESVRASGHSDMLILPLMPEVIACLRETPPPAVAPALPRPVGGGRIKEPRKVHHVNPWYPEAAKNERVQGTVVLEAVISPSGCIRSLKVILSRDPRLDLVSLITVAKWRYTPTLLDGVPVPVIMTITVNFRLS